MPGLRIYHPELRSAIIQIPIPAKAEGGSPKNVQIVVDDTGHCLVSEGVWAELQFAVQSGQLHQFVVINEVADPPALVMGSGIGPDFGRATYVQEQDALREIAPAGVNTQIVEHTIPQNIRSN